MGRYKVTVMIPKRPIGFVQARFARWLRLLGGVALAAWIGVLGAGDQLGASNVSAASLESDYLPVFAKAGPPTAQDDSGTLSGDFQWAAGAATLSEARDRWLEFLARHDPADGTYEDGFHAMRTATAKYELARIFYLIGDAESGDAYLRQADPLDLD